MKDQIAENRHFNTIKEVADFLSVMAGIVYEFLSSRQLINYGSGEERSGWYDLFKPIDVTNDIKLQAFTTSKPEV